VAHFPALVLSRTWTSSPCRVRIHSFLPCSIRSFARSTCPFVRRWATVAQSTWMLLSSQKSRSFSPVNWVPLSVIIELGTPKQKIMSWTKLIACLELILGRGLASIPLVNLSIATSRWVKPPNTFLKGRKRSRPNPAKGHKVHQGLGLDRCLRDLCYVEPHELESTLGNPSHAEAVSNNFPNPCEVTKRTRWLSK
jgi:hypothetical protein